MLPPPPPPQKSRALKTPGVLLRQKKIPHSPNLVPMRGLAPTDRAMHLRCSQPAVHVKQKNLDGHLQHTCQANKQLKDAPAPLADVCSSAKVPYMPKYMPSSCERHYKLPLEEDQHNHTPSRQVTSYRFAIPSKVAPDT